MSVWELALAVLWAFTAVMLVLADRWQSWRADVLSERIEMLSEALLDVTRFSARQAKELYWLQESQKAQQS